MNTIVKRLFTKGPNKMETGKNHWHLEDALVKFSKNKKDYWTLRDAVRGVQILGGIGSGKTSGSGQLLALTYLKNGFGGIVTTGKVNETALWIEYAKRTNRLDDLVIFNPESPLKFNPLDFEMNRQDKGGGDTHNIVALFLSIMKMGGRISEGRSGVSSSDPFWELAMERCITIAIDALKLAGEQITVENIAKVIGDVPFDQFRKADFVELINSDTREDYETLRYWCMKSYTVYCLTLAFENHMDRMRKATFDLTLDYFLSDFPKLAPNTRTSITEQFYAFANPFRSGMLAESFARNTSTELLPEQTFEGKVIILDFPVKQYLTVGIYAQAIYKRLWQQVVERRHVNQFTRPVFQWIDEAQYFLNEDDMSFQTTARESMACSVMLSQSISNYYATMGGDNARSRVDSLLGNLATKIFHANQDHVTNQWAADTIGKVFRPKTSFTAGDRSTSSIGEDLHYQVQPQEFTLLDGGGAGCGHRVQGIVSVTGKQWSNNKNYLKTTFSQKPKI